MKVQGRSWGSFRWSSRGRSRGRSTGRSRRWYWERSRGITRETLSGMDRERLSGRCRGRSKGRSRRRRLGRPPGTFRGVSRRRYQGRSNFFRSAGCLMELTANYWMYLEISLIKENTPLVFSIGAQSNWALSQPQVAHVFAAITCPSSNAPSSSLLCCHSVSPSALVSDYARGMHQMSRNYVPCIFKFFGKESQQRKSSSRT